MVKKTILLLFLFIAEAQAGNLPLIGLDSKGNPTEISIHKNVLDSKMKEAVGALSESTIDSLDKKKLSFYKVSIGTYVKMKLGLGSAITGTAEPYFKLYFTKKGN